MTVTYTADVATCSKFGCFIKLLLRWRGSIYKLVWMDLLLFLGIYYILNFLYRYAMDDNIKPIYESIVAYCKSYGSLIPLSFLLGFFTNIVMQRWWDQYMTIPWPDTLAVFVSVHVHGQDERGRVMRRTVMRYVCVCLTILLTSISPRVKKRFPTFEYYVDAGLLLENERIVLQDFVNANPKQPIHWMPIVWAASIVTRARKEGRIRDDLAVKTIIDELNKFRSGCGSLLFYDYVNIPLVYTQVVTLAVYMYFLCTVMGHQWTDTNPDRNQILDSYFPVFTTIQFLCYIGWLKVAETLINPWGDDDDDFEVNWMIDRDLQMSYLIVDEMHHEHPDLVKDQYWDEVFPQELPYSNEQMYSKYDPLEPSTTKLDFSKTFNKDNYAHTGTSVNRVTSSENLDTVSNTKFNIFKYLNSPSGYSYARRAEKTDKSEYSVKEEFEEENEEELFFDADENSTNDSRHNSKVYFMDDTDYFEKLKIERQRSRIEQQRKIYAKTMNLLTNNPEHSSESYRDSESPIKVENLQTDWSEKPTTTKNTKKLRVTLNVLPDKTDNALIQTSLDDVLDSNTVESISIESNSTHSRRKSF